MKDLSYIEINEELKEILDNIKNGHNVTILGPGGSGKSTLVDILANDPEYGTSGKTIYCGSTGVSAVNIFEKTGKKASTLHRAMGFGVDKIYPGDAITHSKSRDFFTKEVSRIIIDESSMIRVDLMELFLNSLLAYFGLRDASGSVVERLPQIILLGDPLQIEGVVRWGEKQELLRIYESHYFFSSPLYKKFNFVELSLMKIYRTDNLSYLEALRKLRIGSVTREHIDEFNNAFIISSEKNFKEQILPTKETEYTTICTTNKEVEEINNYWMDKIKEPPVTFTSVIWGDVKPSEKIVPDQLVLKKGCRVMIRKNHPGGAYVNGTIGTVTSLPNKKYIEGDSSCYVGVSVNGENYRIKTNTWDITDAFGDIVGEVSQFPLSVCYALTVHKSQGNQFDYMLIKPGRGFFASGQLYTALSRSSNPTGMRLLKPIKYSDVKIDHNALAWNNKIINK